eukprot:COSAG06_NODE_37691_length_432_cov_0.774775_1_plen_57_part_01
MHRLRADENERPQNVSVGNDLSRLTADEELVRQTLLIVHFCWSLSLVEQLQPAKSSP